MSHVRTADPARQLPDLMAEGEGFEHALALRDTVPVLCPSDWPSDSPSRVIRVQGLKGGSLILDVDW